MAHVVVAGPEAIGGKQLLEVLAQGGRLRRQVGTGDGLSALDQVLRQRHPLGQIKGLLQQMAQQGEHPHEDWRVARGREAAVHPAGPGACGGRLGMGWRQLERRQGGLGAAEAIGLQPGQIRSNGVGIAVALAVQPAQVGGGLIRQVALRQGRHDRFQLRPGGGIGGGEFWVGGEQPQQLQQPLQIQQARVAVQLEALLAVAGRADAVIEAGQLIAQ